MSNLDFFVTSPTSGYHRIFGRMLRQPPRDVMHRMGVYQKLYSNLLGDGIAYAGSMIGLLHFVLAILVSPFRSKSRLGAENAVLLHQLIVLRRKVNGRAQITNNDRWFFIQLYRWFPSILEVLTIIRPETLVHWHRAGFRSYWRSKSRRRGGRPQIQTELRVLIRQMSIGNPLWGAPRIHGELLKLGFQVAQSSVAKYMAKRRGPPSQGWCTFLRNHAAEWLC
jgi:hypothetical protein